MVSTLMSEQRSALSLRLDQLRSQVGSQQPPSPTASTSEQNNQDIEQQEELQILGHLEALSLATLSKDVLYQV